MPSYNPDEHMITFLQALIAGGARKIIIVNDGSEADRLPYFEEAAAYPEVDLLTHEVNKGKGRAIKTAIAHYRSMGYENEFLGLITADDDGQHAPADVQKMADALAELYSSSGASTQTATDNDKNDDRHPDRTIILGVRDFGENVPFRSRIGNTLTRKLFHLFYGVPVQDTQTGLRAIPNELLEFCENVRGERYEYEMNVLTESALHKIALKQLGIATIYIDKNSASRFHVVRDSWKIYKVLFGRFFKYALSSLSSCLIDVGLFQLFIMLLKDKVGPYILTATVLARIVSSFYNYSMNRKVVFGTGNVKKTIFRYYLLAVCQMLVSAGLVTGAKLLLPVLPESLIKVVVDTLLFFISYRIQQNFIFTEKHA